MDTPESKRARQRTLRFAQVFQLIGAGYAEYVELSQRWLDAEREQMGQQCSGSAEWALAAENCRLYKCHAQRLARLQRDHERWRRSMERASRRFPSPSPSADGSLVQRWHSLTSLCRRPSPQRQPSRPQSMFSLQPATKGEPEPADHSWRSPVVSSLRPVSDPHGDSVRQQQRVARAAISAIEAETVGLLGKLQFDVQVIVGFARLCVGDVFDVVVKHGHQRWRARGKTQQDKSQKWERQSVQMDVLWNMPVVVKVVEVRLLKSRVLNERQFDPAKFALAQPQLVTMNLNGVGSIKLQMVVTWLPLISTKPMSHLQNGKSSPPSPVKSAAGGGGLPQQPRTNPNSAPAPPPKKYFGAEIHSNGHPAEERERSYTERPENGDVPVKVCLRDKKRQREQRLQLANSVAVGEALAADKEKWRCSSTTLLDELYKDLSRSIPTIDDLTVLSPSNCSSSSKTQPPHHRSFGSENAPSRPEKKERRLFPFVKRAHSEADERKKDWRKSASLGQIALSKDEQFVAVQHIRSADEQDESASAIVQLERGTKSGERAAEIGGGSLGHRELNGVSGSPRRGKLSSLKRGRAANANGPSSPSGSPPPRNAQIATQHKTALRTAEQLLRRIDSLRALLARMREQRHEYTELVAFEAAMLNWEACLKLNRAGLMCQLDAELGGTSATSSFGRRSANADNSSGRLGESAQLRQRLAANRCSLYLHNGTQPHSPSTASDETDESAGAGAHRTGSQSHGRHTDQISENDSGIDSLRQNHSPYNSANGHSLHFPDRRKSLGAMLELNVLAPAASPSSPTGNPEVDKCLGIHLERAERALEAILDVQDSPFEYTLTKMLCSMEAVETVALETMLALAQEGLSHGPPNAENVLAQLGAEPQVVHCWLTVCRPLGAFLLLPARLLRAQLHRMCEPIVRARYPKLAENVLDSLMGLLCDGVAPDQVGMFQFAGLFRGKPFTAFIENLSHEAWIVSSLSSGQPSAIRTVMERLRGVPIAPPLESLRHIALVLAREGGAATVPIEKYLRKGSPELQLDLCAYFLCLLEHQDPNSRSGACRALALLKQANAIQCLDFLAQSDSAPPVRTEAKKAAALIRRNGQMRQFYDGTKI